MEIEQAIYDLLIGMPGLNSLVGDRVYPLILPQKPTLPAITYQRVSSTTPVSHSGISGIEKSRMSLRAFASSYTEAKKISKFIKEAMLNVKQVMGGIRCGVTHDVEVDDYEQDVKIFSVMNDFTIWHILEVA